MSETKHDIQPGDVVRLKPLTVVAIEDDGGIRVDIGRSYTGIMTPELIDSVEARPLAVGDPVTRHGWDGKWSIVAINGGDAWIVSQDVSHAIARLSHLTRVDQ